MNEPYTQPSSPYRTASPPRRRERWPTVSGVGALLALGSLVGVVWGLVYLATLVVSVR